MLRHSELTKSMRWVIRYSLFKSIPLSTDSYSTTNCWLDKSIFWLDKKANCWLWQTLILAVVLIEWGLFLYLPLMPLLIFFYSLFDNFRIWSCSFSYRFTTGYVSERTWLWSSLLDCYTSWLRPGSESWTDRLMFYFYSSLKKICRFFLNWRFFTEYVKLYIIII